MRRTNTQLEAELATAQAELEDASTKAEQLERLAADIGVRRDAYAAEAGQARADLSRTLEERDELNRRLAVAVDGGWQTFAELNVSQDRLKATAVVARAAGVYAEALKAATAVGVDLS
jgi:chromosome segregation ATPase